VLHQPDIQRCATAVETIQCVIATKRLRIAEARHYSRPEVARIVVEL